MTRKIIASIFTSKAQENIINESAVEQEPPSLICRAIRIYEQKKRKYGGKEENERKM